MHAHHFKGRTDMTRVLMLATNPTFTRHAMSLGDHRVATIEAEELDRVIALGGLAAFVGGLSAPDVVMVGDLLPVGEALTLAEAIRREVPGAHVVLVSDPDRVSMVEAMRAGVRDVIPSSASAHDIESLWARFEGSNVRSIGVHGVPAEAAPEDSSRIIVVTGPRGGVGRSTVAVNLAVALAAEAPRDTVLVDLDLQFGDVGLMLDLDPLGTIGDVFEVRSSMDSLVLKTFLTAHAGGLWVLCSSPTPTVVDRATPEAVSRLLQRLAAEFRYVVVDTGARLDPFTVAAVGVATDHVAVTSMDVSSARALRRQLAMLSSVGDVPESRHVVLNRAERTHGVGPREIESLLGIPVDVVVPSAAEVPAAANFGTPAVWRKRGGPFGKAIAHLVQRIHEGELSVVAKHRGVDVA
ncbi:MinD/ParA family protein [Aeromicrobium ginsengisoli]|uniref:MinD/ParA family protein n=2 Tax=Aeromicrobium ginsengisoli TaxID=363867 RepID=A0A5M4FKE1_9ACTN|nr:MinD/ParA family protein [Aeromicrobium ginsengisoli]